MLYIDGVTVVALPKESTDFTLAGARERRHRDDRRGGFGAVPEKSFRAQRLYDVDAGGAGGWEHRSDYRRA